MESKNNYIAHYAVKKRMQRTLHLYFFTEDGKGNNWRFSRPLKGMKTPINTDKTGLKRDRAVHRINIDAYVLSGT